MFKKSIFMLILLSVIFMPAKGQAENIWEMAKSESYGRKAGGMFGRGLLNAATCFVDIIVQTVDKTKSGPPVVGTLTGLGGGAACTILRAGSGIVDVATFWIPDFNGVPVSKSYHNCIETEEAAPVQQFVQPAAVQPAPVVVSSPAPDSQDAMRYVKKGDDFQTEGGSDAMKYVKK